MHKPDYILLFIYSDKNFINIKNNNFIYKIKIFSKMSIIKLTVSYALYCNIFKKIIKIFFYLIEKINICYYL